MRKCQHWSLYGISIYFVDNISSVSSHGAQQQQSDAFSFQTSRCNAEQIYNFPRQWQFYRRKYHFSDIFCPKLVTYIIQVKSSLEMEEAEKGIYILFDGNLEKVKAITFLYRSSCCLFNAPISLILAVKLTLSLNTPGSGSKQI